MGWPEPALASSDVSVTLHELTELSDAAWDGLIASYPAATVFHTSAWHAVLGATHPGRVVRLRIDVDDEVRGYWCGFLLQKFGMRVFGAPLPGTATDYMFPLVTAPLDVDEFLAAVRTWAATKRVGLIELGGEYLDDARLLAHGYQLQPTRTYRVDLSAGETAVWQQLKPAMRNKVRKAEKQGVVVVEETSPTFPRDFSDMLRSVFNRQGIAPTYDLRRLEAVTHVMSEAGRLIALTAFKDDERLSSVILLHDATTMYFWAGASYPTAYPFGSNDLIQWRALQRAMALGLRRYDACGGGDYKEKFGGALIALPAGHLVANPIFGLVRRSVQRGYRARQALLGAVQRVTTGRR